MGKLPGEARPGRRAGWCVERTLVRRDIEASDAAQLAETLERDLARPMVELNHGPRDAYPAVRIERPAEHDAEQTASVLARLVPLGLRVREADVRARLGYGEPADGDAVLRAPGNAAGPPGKPPGQAGKSTRQATASTVGDADGDPLERVLNAIDADEWERLSAPVVRPILDRAKADPEALLGDIAAVYPDMDSDALAERLARILFVADLWGLAARD